MHSCTHNDDGRKGRGRRRRGEGGLRKGFRARKQTLRTECTIVAEVGGEVCERTHRIVCVRERERERQSASNRERKTIPLSAGAFE